MKIAKELLLTIGLLAAGSILFAQQQSVKKSNSNNNETETSVENEYLNDVDGDIIMSLANSDDLDNKLVALQYLKSAIEEGNTSDTVIRALDQLAGEGLFTQSTTKGRVMNNFPEIRREACLLMAKVPTEHSKNTLISVVVADNEPMVMAAAVKSLGVIGINNNDETVEAIAFANRRNQVLNPTGSLALEVINTFEMLADSTENKKSMIDALTRISSDYHYVTPVRQRAQKLLKKLSNSANQSQSGKKSSTVDAK